jgi:tetratricopeptide (TPR) repeat protein
MGDLEKAEEEYKKLQERKEPIVYTWSGQRLGTLYLIQGRFKDYRNSAQKGIENAERLGQNSWMRSATFGLSNVERKLGNYDRALELLERIWKSAVEDEAFGTQRSVLFNRGLTYLEMKSIDEAQKTADKLKKMIEQAMNKKLIRNYYRLMGMIELEKNNYSKAIEYYKKAIPLLSATSGTHLGLAYRTGLAYYKAGNLENARQEYERVVSLTTGRQGSGDLYAKSFYMLGMIYEQRGNRSKAIENYEKFLDLWKDADPDIREVEDARKRLAALKGLP